MKNSNKKHIAIKFLWLFSILVIFFYRFPSPAYADEPAYGRDWLQFYFSGGMLEQDGDWLFWQSPDVPYIGLTPNPGTITAQSFINMMRDRLYDKSSVADQADAAAVVDIMLGQLGPSFGGSYQNGIAYAQSHFDTAPPGQVSFVYLVNFYDQKMAPGYSVEWNRLADWSTDVPNPLINSGSEANSGQTENLPDIFFTNTYGPIPEQYGVFFHGPDGSVFAIAQSCANISGTVDSLPLPPVQVPTPTPLPTPTPTPIPTYTISGNVFVDSNKNGLIDAGETNYPGGITITSSTGTVTTNANGSYTITNILAGSVTVSYTSLPTAYSMTSPINGPPPSYIVTVGACKTNGATGATCTGGNIANLNFGMSNLRPWYQSTCGDMRNDNGLTDYLPDYVPNGQFALISNPTCPSSPIAFTGSLDAFFGNGNASSSNQVVGGSSYPEVFSASSPLETAFSSLLAKAQAASITPVNLATVCPLAACSLPATLPHGIYLANGNLTLNAATLGTNANYIFLVNGNLTLNGNIAVPIGSTALFSTTNNITVGPAVGSAPNSTASSLAGWYIAGQNFIVTSAGNCNDLRLNVAGSVVVNALANGGTFQNNRDLCGNDPSDPTVSFSQRLDMILNAPQFLAKQLTISQEIAP